MGLLNFSSFIPVDYTGGSTDQQALNAAKRHRGVGGTIDESLTPMMRMRAKMRMKKNKSKLKRGMRRAMSRTANLSTLKKRAVRRAKSFMISRILHGKSKSELSYGARASLERQLARRSSAIQTLSKRLIGVARKDERQRHQHHSK